ncbi:DNA polymerase III subunit chi [Brucella intermedia]|uniref:DNA polymerase III subunit chi n=1 Tax=Brucella intermedia TaxID=94625 RepID=UPI001591F95F|nr:DNA polymerase III subunit chi [Brucella intermedia]
MAEILFYHLTESTLDEALPGLVERSLGRGWRVTIQTISEERRDALDGLLWTFSDTSFVAHGTDKEPHPEHQPVLLTTSEANPNGATVRFLVEGAGLEQAGAYERLVVMFDGHDQEQLDIARGQWKSFKAENHDLTYWQQTPDRRWERKA